MENSARRLVKVGPKCGFQLEPERLLLIFHTFCLGFCFGLIYVVIRHWCRHLALYRKRLQLNKVASFELSQWLHPIHVTVRLQRLSVLPGGYLDLVHLQLDLLGEGDDLIRHVVDGRILWLVGHDLTRWNGKCYLLFFDDGRLHLGG